MTGNQYLSQILYKYQVRNLSLYTNQISNLKTILKGWANSCFIETLESGSRAKWTAIHLASDVDYLVSLKSNCNESSWWLKSIYDSLYVKLKEVYWNSNVRKQNVSFRIIIGGDLEVDVTPARKHSGNTNYHWLYVSKKDTWQQTNIQIHKTDISQSWRTNEIKLLKIWRELNNLDFPSIYAEYLIIDNILHGKTTNIDYLADNFLYILRELSKDSGNPLFARIVDPANSNNTLSDLLTINEKNLIINKAKESSLKPYWENIIW
ncbi:MAG: hypothetical protein ACD_71C00032G0003 [uncultured bacterium (gcode 4)]|uniref:Nucleotidyltransferase n=1 Tax=uncultured bacterium (gcode 4) TaxID=1234023 RepID=K1YP67_9BACT|nr:MAG: hypothetical protein ACD_71C00032G0003 [uncultured bacterium (gcode 4)]